MSMVVPLYVQPIVGEFYRRGGHDALPGSILYFDFYTEAGRSNSFCCPRAGIFLMVQLVPAPLMPASTTCFSYKA